MTSTTPIRGHFVIEKLAHDTFHQHTKFGDSSFSHSGDMIVGVEVKKVGHVTLTTSFVGWFVLPKLGFDIAYLCIKFDDSI